MAVEKVTFTLPEELVRRLEKVPAGKRSHAGQEGCRERARPRGGRCSAQTDEGKGDLEGEVSSESAHRQRFCFVSTYQDASYGMSILLDTNFLIGLLRGAQTYWVYFEQLLEQIAT